MKKLLMALALLMVLFTQGCALVRTAVAVGAAYGLSQAFK